jgi:hypothetical protein
MSQYLDPHQASARRRRGARRSARQPEAGEDEQARSDRYAKTLRPILIELRYPPVEKIADELTKRKIAKPLAWRTVARLHALGLYFSPCCRSAALSFHL